MKYTFVPMNQEYASTIVDTWKYEKEYSIYDYSNEADHMLDEEGWGRGIFAVLNQGGDLIGELSIEFFDAQGQYTEYCNFDEEALINEREIWIGFGLRPDLVGQGSGTKFVRLALNMPSRIFIIAANMCSWAWHCSINEQSKHMKKQDLKNLNR